MRRIYDERASQEKSNKPDQRNDFRLNASLQGNYELHKKQFPTLFGDFRLTETVAN